MSPRSLVSMDLLAKQHTQVCEKLLVSQMASDF